MLLSFCVGQAVRSRQLRQSLSLRNSEKYQKKIKPIIFQTSVMKVSTTMHKNDTENKYYLRNENHTIADTMLNDK